MKVVDEIDLAIATMERQENELGAIEVHFAFDLGVSASGSAASDLPMDLKHHRRECIDGPRTRLESFGLMYSHKYDVTEVLDSDGSMKRYDPNSRRGSIATGSLPLSYRSCCSIFTEGLLARLQKYRPELWAARDVFQGKNTLRVTWDDASYHGKATCWLDPSQYYQPLQIEIDIVTEPAEYPDGRTRMFSRLTVFDFWKSERAALPTRVQETHEALWPDGRRLLLFERMMTVSQIKRNVNFDPAEFDFVFPEGTLVTDHNRGVYYYEGQPDSEQRLGEPSTPNAGGAVASAPDVREIDFWDWLLIGGLGLFALGVFLKRRAARQ